MNEQAVAIFNAMNEVYDIKDVAEVEQYSKKLKPHLSAILATIKETVLCNSKLFDAMFVMNFSENKKVRIMCEYMGLNEIGLRTAKDKEDVFKFCASTMTYECLSEIYPTVKTLLGLSRKEFLMSWLFLSKSRQLVDVFFAKKHDKEDLTKEALSMMNSRNKEYSVMSMINKVRQQTDKEDEGNEG